MKIYGIERDYVQCRNKLNNQKASIKSTKTLRQLQGWQKKPPKFFDDLDNFLNDKPDATGVANAIDTSYYTVNEAGNESDVDIGNIIIIISFTLKMLPHAWKL